jgi:hypothetical protein
LGYEYGKVFNFEKNKELFNFLGKIKNLPQEKENWNIENWLTFTDKNFGFSFKYPKEIEIENPVGGWRYLDDKNSGIKLVSLRIPQIYEPNTNFGEAYLNIGVSSSTFDIQNCFLPHKKEEALGNLNVGNIMFYSFSSTDVLAGNYYKIKSYRTLQNNLCYNIDFIIHYMDINLFPSYYQIKNFNEKRIEDILDKIFNSFIFLN